MRIVLLTACLVLTMISGFSQTLIPPNHPHIKFSGRIDYTNLDKPTFSYSGVRIRTIFEGTSLELKLNNLSEENFFFVIIDQSSAFKLKVSKGTLNYPIASGLKDTLHSVELIKISEGSVGICEFHGFLLDEGKGLIEMPADNGRRIEFIGNSITCGYGVEVLDKDLHIEARTENFYNTYAAITARAFSADYQAICRSGIGIYRNYDGPTSGSPDNMPQIYNQIFYNQASPLWDFEANDPDVVTINLGTNDFSTSGADSALFVSAYDRFISQIRLNYPLAKIILLMGPMNNENTLKSYLTFLVQKHTAEGDQSIYFFEMSSQWNSDFGLGADWHPSRRQHRENASELIQYIETICSWTAETTVKDIEVLDTARIRLSFSEYIKTVQTGEGFKVLLNDNIDVPVKSVEIDPENSKWVNLYLDDHLDHEDQVDVSYIDSTLESVNEEKVQRFYMLHAVNTLKAPLPQYTLSIDINGSGTVSGAGTYDENAIVSVTATPDDGWFFANWSGETTSTSASINLIMNSDKSLTAHFEEEASALNQAEVRETSLSNYPNPFTASTMIHYSIYKPSPIEISVYDVYGKQIEVLVSQIHETGDYQVEWNDAGYPGGIYFLRLHNGSDSVLKKVILSK